MPTYFPAHPDHHHYFRTTARRMLPIGIAVYIIATLLIPFPVPLWALVTLLIVPLSVNLLICTMPWGWWRTVGWTRSTRPVLPYPLSYHHALASGLTGLLCIAPLFALDDDSLGLHFALPIAALGMGLLMLATRGLQIVPPACPECAYPVHNLALPTKCPECGFPLDSLEDATEVGHIHRPQHTLAASALLVVGVSIFFLFPLERSDFNALLPQRVLFRLAHADQISFANLNTAALTTEQENTLTERIIAARAHHRFFRIQPQLDWLANRVLTGHLTPEQIERAVNGPMTVRLVPTAQPGTQPGTQPRASQPIELELFIDAGPIGRTLITRTYFIEHLDIDGVTVIQFDPHAQHPAMAGFSPRFFFGWLIPRLNFPPRPIHTFTPTAPGPITLRTRIIAIVAPSGVTPTIAWNPDATYTLTPEPIATIELTAQTTLQVAP